LFVAPLKYQEEPMTPKRTVWTFVIATLIFAVVCLAVWFIPKKPNQGFADATATLTFITGAAIAIERVIETVWTIVGGIKGTYWPLNAIHSQVQGMEADLNTAMRPFHEQMTAELDKLAQGGKLAEEGLARAKREVTRMKERFDEILKLTPDNQRTQLLAAAASQNVAYLYKKYGEVVPGLEEAVDTANAAINGLQDFLSSFKDNPGRRLISIYLGAAIGVVVAGIFNLDVFQAVLETPAPANSAGLAGRVILTGLVMGLGSNPTHEVIRSIQVYKEGRKSTNISRPNLPPEKNPEAAKG
jgi:hypothetical protein